MHYESKSKNSYSKWPPFAHTESLSLYGHSSIELCNTSSGKSAAAFQRGRFKAFNIGMSLFASHLLKLGPQFVVQGV